MSEELTGGWAGDPFEIALEAIKLNGNEGGVKLSKQTLEKAGYDAEKPITVLPHEEIRQSDTE